LNEVPVGFVGVLDGIEFGVEDDIVCEAARTNPSALKDDYDGALFGGTDLDFEILNGPPLKGAGSICQGQAFFINKGVVYAGKPAQVTRKRGVGPVASPKIATRGPGQSGVYTATILGKASVVTERVVIMQDRYSTWRIVVGTLGAETPDTMTLLDIAALLRSK
jgi:hypothetical protein